MFAPADVTEAKRQGQGIGDVEAMRQMAVTAVPEILRNLPGTSTPMSALDAALAAGRKDYPGAAMAALGAVPFAGALKYADEAQIAMREVLDAADAAWKANLRRNIPDVVYHGSPRRNLQQIDPTSAQEVKGSSWFTNNPDVAEQYTYPREYGRPVFDAPAGKVYPARLDVTNPYVVDLAKESRGSQLALGEQKRMARLVEEAKAAGRDALVVKNVDDTVDSSGLPGTSIAVWDKNKIALLKRKKRDAK
jgi:hypothetical protein